MTFVLMMCAGCGDLLEFICDLKPETKGERKKKSNIKTCVIIDII